VIAGVTVKDDQEGSYSPLTTMLPLWARGAALAGAQEDNPTPASQTKAVIRDKITIKKEGEESDLPKSTAKNLFFGIAFRGDHPHRAQGGFEQQARIILRPTEWVCAGRLTPRRPLRRPPNPTGRLGKLIVQ